MSDWNNNISNYEKEIENNLLNFFNYFWYLIKKEN
jgi:hypothetical protein